MIRRTGIDEPRDFYAFVDGVHRNNPRDARSRIVLHLDCVDSGAFDASDEAADHDENLALVRIMTTDRALSRHFEIEGLAEGDWIKITVQKRAGMPRAWALPAELEYQVGPSTNLVEMTRIPDGQPMQVKLSTACTLLQASAKQAPLASAFMSHAAHFAGTLKIIALDVGQASSAVIFSDDKAIGFFDVGAPIWWNQKSMRSGYRPPAIVDGFVMLSHWDFDHFDQARRFPQLLNLDWFAPNQPVGLNTARFQKKIGSRLTFVYGPATFSHGIAAPNAAINIAPGTCTDPKDRNGTGYAMQIIHGGETALLLGDSDYIWVMPSMLAGSTAITIPHHGGRGSTPPSPAGGRALAVVSYGKPNSYKHPDESHLSAHGLAGWRVSRTATHRASGVKRGGRRLI